LLLKRLGDVVDAEDHIYAVILGVAGSSDDRGKGITAPNPVGQKLAVQRAWAIAGVPPRRCPWWRATAHPPGWQRWSSTTAWRRSAAVPAWRPALSGSAR
jgi:hypothetical protein